MKSVVSDGGSDGVVVAHAADAENRIEIGEFAEESQRGEIVTVPNRSPDSVVRMNCKRSDCESINRALKERSSTEF